MNAKERVSEIAISFVRTCHRFQVLLLRLQHNVEEMTKVIAQRFIEERDFLDGGKVYKLDSVIFHQQVQQVPGCRPREWRQSRYSRYLVVYSSNAMSRAHAYPLSANDHSLYSLLGIKSDLQLCSFDLHTNKTSCIRQCCKGLA